MGTFEQEAVDTNEISSSMRLTHFSPVSHFYTPWKRQNQIASGAVPEKICFLIFLALTRR